MLLAAVDHHQGAVQTNHTMNNQKLKNNVADILFGSPPDLMSRITPDPGNVHANFGFSYTF